MEEYEKLPVTAGKQYAARKIQGLLLSYLTTALLVNPDKKEGRTLAAQRMRECLGHAPEAHRLALGKYRVFCLLNRMHIGKSAWDAILSSRLYNRLRGNHDFT